PGIQHVSAAATEDLSDPITTVDRRVTIAYHDGGRCLRIASIACIDHVAPGAAGDVIEAVSTIDGGVARTSSNIGRVIRRTAVTSVEQVRSTAAGELVYAVATINRRCAGSGPNRVIAVASDQRVDSGTAVDRSTTRPTDDVLVPRSSQDCVSPGATEQCVVAARAVDQGVSGAG